jgi:hypothetical protein
MLTCNETTLLNIDIEHGIQGALEVKNTIQEAMEHSDNVVLEIQNLESIHLTYVHMLCAAFCTARDLGKKLEVKNATGDLIAYAKRIGFGQGNCNSPLTECNCPWR